MLVCRGAALSSAAAAGNHPSVFFAAPGRSNVAPRLLRLLLFIVAGYGFVAFYTPPAGWCDHRHHHLMRPPPTRVDPVSRGGEVHLPGAYSSVSFAHYAPNSTVTVTAAEEATAAPCSFLDVTTQSPASCTIESYTRAMIRRHVRPEDHVMELGARFGTATCEIASLLRNSGNQIAVDPDPAVWSSLEFNRHVHLCSFWLVRGVIADRAASTTQNGYASRGIPNQNDDHDKLVRSHYTLGEIQNITGLRLTVLVVDCEGCLPFLFPADKGDDGVRTALAHVRVILMEGDMPIAPGTDCSHDCVDYKEWEDRLQRVGFTMAEKSVDSQFPWINNYIFVREG
jgi:hypothetical protein